MGGALLGYDRSPKTILKALADEMGSLVEFHPDFCPLSGHVQPAAKCAFTPLTGLSAWYPRDRLRELLTCAAGAGDCEAANTDRGKEIAQPAVVDFLCQNPERLDPGDGEQDIA